MLRASFPKFTYATMYILLKNREIDDRHTRQVDTLMVMSTKRLITLLEPNSSTFCQGISKRFAISPETLKNDLADWLETLKL